MKKALLIILPLIFTAQACNFLFGGLYGDKGSGSRGMFVSVDSGDTWLETNAVGQGRALASAQVTAIFVEPDANDNILAATFNSGVFASDTKAANWLQLLPDFSAYAAFINPSNSDEIYAAGSRGSLASILKSSDRGKTWVQIYTDPTAGEFVSALAFDPRVNSTFYAGLSSGIVIKSTDGGVTWHKSANFGDRIERIVTTEKTAVYAMGRKTGIRKSTDGGRTWVEKKLADSPGGYNDLVFDGTNLYLASDKGLYTSTDEASTWTKVELPLGPEGSDIEAVAVNPDDKLQIFVGVGHTVFRSDDRGETWRTTALPTRRLINALVIDPVEPNRIYAGFQ